MKKRILSAVLVSGVTLGSAVATVKADDHDSKIAAQDAVINNLTSEQKAAQTQVDTIKGQVTSLQTQQTELEEQNTKLEAESKKLGEDIKALSSKIVARNESLKKQARSAQKSSSAASYINTILNSKSISDAINRIVAVREVVSANEKMLEQQEEDKLTIEQKQVENQEAINTVAANKATIAQNQLALTTQQAELEVAQLNLSAQLATAEDEKASLLAQKAAAEQVAAEAAQAQAGSATQVQTTVQNNTSPVPQPTVTPSVPSTPSSNSGNGYYEGECTWGVKQLASWVGNNWGNACQWIDSARVAGHSVGTEPRVGAVAVWPYDGGGYGHVAYVTAVRSSTNIQVTESNYAGKRYIANHRNWFNPTDSMWGGGTVYYIYP